MNYIEENANFSIRDSYKLIHFQIKFYCVLKKLYVFAEILKLSLKNCDYSNFLSELN